MSDVNKDIGARIKGIRELSDYTIEQLAEAINISAEKLLSFEKGESEIPVSIIHNISVELKISMTELLTGEEAKLSVYSVVRKDKGIGVDRRAAYDYKALAYNFANRKLDPYMITIPVKPENEPFSLNSHEGHEFHFCMEGSFEIHIDKHVITINEGDAIYFNSAYEHGMKALNGKPAKELVIIT